MEHVFSCSEACGIFPVQGSTVSSVLADGFLTTGSPGKSKVLLIIPILQMLNVKVSGLHEVPQLVLGRGGV